MIMKEDYVVAIARAAAPRLGGLSTPSAIIEITAAAIRTGIDEYRSRNQTLTPERLRREWIKGMLVGIAVTLVGMFAGAFLMHIWRM